jgi:hypothetical protein
MNIKLTETALITLLTFAGVFGAGYRYGLDQSARNRSQDSVVCVTPQDIAKAITKRPTS